MKIALICISFVIVACSLQQSQTVSHQWAVNALTSIGGWSTQVEGDPRVIADAVYFDGDGDRLLVDKNPLAGATEFTIEIEFKPYHAYPDNWEPRFFHIESADNSNRRVTIELRLNDKKQWYLDAYIKSENSQLTLIDSTKVHPVGEWFHAAITYKDRTFTSFVNGKKELEGQVDYLPIAENAKTSIGARMNQIHWFKGEIKKVRVTHKALTTEEFLEFRQF